MASCLASITFCNTSLEPTPPVPLGLALIIIYGSETMRIIIIKIKRTRLMSVNKAMQSSNNL